MFLHPCLTLNPCRLRDRVASPLPLAVAAAGQQRGASPRGPHRLRRRRRQHHRHGGELLPHFRPVSCYVRFAHKTKKVTLGETPFEHRPRQRTPPSLGRCIGLPGQVLLLGDSARGLPTGFKSPTLMLTCHTQSRVLLAMRGRTSELPRDTDSRGGRLKGTSS